jgi:hypothetical protein
MKFNKRQQQWASAAGMLSAVAMMNSCAGAPATLARMTPDAIQSASDKDLCFAHALYIEMRENHPVIKGEVARRGADCSDQIARKVEDCSMLTLDAAVQTVTDEGEKATNYIVTNRSEIPREFRVCHDANTTKGMIVGPSGTGKFVVPRSAELTGIAVMSGNYCTTPRLFSCVASPDAVPVDE